MNRPEIFSKILEGRTKPSYLEIGVDDPNNTFNHVKADSKIGVDPYSDKTECHAWNVANKELLIDEIGGDFYPVTSDEFFEELDKRKKFDLVFIDGMHTKEQVLKDVENALKHLKKDGLIVLDDSYPQSEYEAKTPPDAGQPWRGTVYQAVFELRREYFDKVTLVSNEGANLTFIKKGKMDRYEDANWGDKLEISYEYYSCYKHAINNEMDLDKILKDFS